MSDDFPDLPDVLEASIDPDTISVDGDPNEMLEEMALRIEELTSALSELDEDNPERELARFELEVLTEARNALEVHLENLEENDE